MSIQRPQVQIQLAREEDPSPEPEFRTELSAGGRSVLLALALFAIVFVAFLPAMRGQFILNDEQNIAANFAARRVTEALRLVWLAPAQLPDFAPLGYTAFVIECKPFKLRSMGYHFVSLLLHATCATLLWTLLRRQRLPGAFVAAALVAAHPLHVETVAWISQQRVLTCAAFYISAMIVFLRHVGIDPAPGDEPGRLRLPQSPMGLASLSLILALCAMLAHPLGVTFPLAAIVLLWWQRGRVEKSDWMKLAPAIVIAVLVLLAMFAVSRARGGSSSTAELDPLIRAMIAGRAIWTYALSVVFPFAVSFGSAKWNIGAGSSWQCVFVVAAIAVLVGAWILRHRIGRGPLAAAALFVILLVPGLIRHDAWAYSFIADHAAYLASAAIVVPIVVIVSRALAARPMNSMVRPALAAAAVFSLGAIVFVRTPAYANDESLWHAALRRNPRSVAALNQLGLIELRQKHNPAEAASYFTRALGVDSNDLDALLNIAAAYAAQGDPNKAMMQYYQVLDKRPNDADAHLGLGESLNALGQSKEALTEFQKAFELRPTDARAALYIGRIHEFHGEIPEAEKWYREAIRLNPRETDAYLQLALLRFYHDHDIADAQSLLLNLREINPKSPEAYLNAGVMVFEISKLVSKPAEKRKLIDDAIAFFARAAELDSTSRPSLSNLAKALAARSMYANTPQEQLRYLNHAIDVFERAAELGDSESRQLVTEARRQRDALQSGRR